jgi:hypothetical protein
MIKQLFFTTVLLAPGLAYAGTPSATLPGQIVPAGSDPTPPAPATAAGFTTLVLNSDFTTPFYATLSNWLDCAGAGTPSWFLIAQSGDSVAAPCSDIVVGADGSNGQTLQLTWHTADYISGQRHGIDLTSAAGGAGKVFPNFYAEMTERVSGTPANMINMEGPWSWATVAAGGIIEYDGIEIYNPTYTDSAVHNWGAGGAGPSIWFGTAPPHPPSGWDATQYHTYGYRVTSDGSTAIYMCAYIDNIAQGCTSVNNATGTQITSGQTNYLLMGPNTASGSGNQVTMFVENVHIWSCASWQGGAAACRTSSPNP